MQSPKEQQREIRKPSSVISAKKSFISLLAIRWNSAFKWVYLSFSPFPFISLLFIAVCKAFSDNHFAFLFLGDGLAPCLLYNITNLRP